jgi:hypothetical protein
VSLVAEGDPIQPAFRTYPRKLLILGPPLQDPLDCEGLRRERVSGQTCVSELPCMINVA